VQARVCWLDVDRPCDLEQALSHVRLGQLLNRTPPERLLAQPHDANVVVLHRKTSQSRALALSIRVSFRSPSQTRRGASGPSRAGPPCFAGCTCRRTRCTPRSCSCTLARRPRKCSAEGAGPASGERRGVSYFGRAATSTSILLTLPCTRSWKRTNFVWASTWIALALGPGALTHWGRGVRHSVQLGKATWLQTPSGLTISSKSAARAKSPSNPAMTPPK